MIEIEGLSFEQNKKYQAAIVAGYFENYAENPRVWRHTLVGALLHKYPERTKTLDRLRDIVGHIPTWEDINDDVLKDFVDECSEDGMAPSSIRTVCAELKSIINSNRRKVDSEDFMKILSVRQETSQAVYLTRDEMQRIINFKPYTELEKFVRRNFVISMLTGARQCDAIRLNIHYCDADTGMLSYVPKKTPGIVVNVPVDERYGLRKFLSDRYKRECCRDVFNETIRSICRQCNIDTECTIKRRGQMITAPKWQLISSHTARRSFATNLYLAGISLEDIALMMGHGKNIETTKRYICAEREMSFSVMSYFQSRSAIDTDRPY